MPRQIASDGIVLCRNKLCEANPKAIFSIISMPCILFRVDRLRGHYCEIEYNAVCNFPCVSGAVAGDKLSTSSIARTTSSDMRAKSMARGVAFISPPYPP